MTHRHPHVGRLAERAWALRNDVSLYGGLHVGLAAELDVAQLTSDARLTRAPGLPCEVHLL